MDRGEPGEGADPARRPGMRAGPAGARRVPARGSDRASPGGRTGAGGDSGQGLGTGHRAGAADGAALPGVEWSGVEGRTAGSRS